MSTIQKLAEEIAEVQHLVLENLCKGESSALINKNKTLLSEISKYDEAVVKNAIGILGENLIKFSKAVDLDHPLLKNISDVDLSESGELYHCALEAFEIAKDSDVKWKSTIEILKNHINKNHKDISKKILHIPPRFLRSAEDRDKERMKKSSKNIDLSKVLKNGEDEFFRYAPTFLKYIRHNECWKNDISKNTKIMNRLHDIGLNAQCDLIREEINKIKDITKDSYCGFFRLKMKDAALILARVFGCKFEFGVNKILVPQNVFKDEQFWNIAEPIGEDEIYELDSSDVYRKHRHDTLMLPYLDYTPRAYPFAKFKSKRTEGVDKIIDAVESHPSMNGKPLFDHLWVIVPGVSIPNDGSVWHINLDGEHHKFNDYWGCYSRLDAYLTDKGLICPIILGENVVERKCYFISYWV